MLISCLVVGAVCLVVELTKSGTKKAAEELNILENETEDATEGSAEESFDGIEGNMLNEQLRAKEPKVGRTFFVKKDPIIQLVTVIQVGSIILLFVVFFI
ncbi:MAG: hypothetical protein IKS09_07115, partial [Lachnospiraceae bacterium]|nr:hypothetical protein [Lachnospiraceae bacterium]